jgi:putative DNA primase/helicase
MTKGNVIDLTPRINQEAAKREFIEALQSNSLKLSGPLIADGKFHRCDAANKERWHGKGDGAYVLHLDNIPAGAFINYTLGVGWQKWRYKISRSLSETEQREIACKIEAAQEAHRDQSAKEYERARRKAVRLWKSAQEASVDHPYLRTKRLKEAPGLRQLYNGRLVVPGYNEENKLQTLQYIYPNGFKLFLKGGKAGGCHYWIEKPDENDKTICICEGWATGESIFRATKYPVLVAFNAPNLRSVAEWARQRYPDRKFIICADDDIRSEGNPGLTHAQKAARAVRGFVAVPTFGDNREDDQKDFNDQYAALGAKAVRTAVDAAKVPGASTEDHIDELAKLDALTYEQQREAAAKDLGIRRLSVLDALVEKRRAELAEDHQHHKEMLLPHWEVEPWPEPVDTSALLRDVTDQITRYIATLGDRAIAPALWTMFSYIHKSATHSPSLLVTSPEPNSGKTTLLGVLSYLAHRALPSVSISGPMLFRSIEKWGPTFVVDEADTALVSNTDLKEVINSGWTRGQGVVRCDPETYEPRMFSTFAPKIVGMKGKKLPDTTLSRAIVIEMKRKQPDEIVADFEHMDNDDLHTLRRKLVRWAADNGDILRTSKPEVPPGFYNRTRKNWQPLLAIAELAGDEAAQVARKAAKIIEGRKHVSETSLGTQLLADIRGIFDTEKIDAIHSGSLVDELNSDLEKSWAEYKHGKPLSQKQLANMLDDFGIIPADVTVGSKRARGYQQWQFEEAWDRYLPKTPHQPSHPRKMHENRGLW